MSCPSSRSSIHFWDLAENGTDRPVKIGSTKSLLHHCASCTTVCFFFFFVVLVRAIPFRDGHRMACKYPGAGTKRRLLLMLKVAKRLNKGKFKVMLEK